MPYLNCQGTWLFIRNMSIRTVKRDIPNQIHFLSCMFTFLFFFYFLFYFYKKCSTVLIASPQISGWKCYQIKHWDKVLFYNCLTETCNEVQKLYAFASRTLLFLFSLGKTSEDRLSTKIDRSKGEKKWRVRCLLIRAATVCSWISIANSSSLKYLPNCDQQQQQK